MARLLTVSAVREHLETDVTDAVLQRLVDDADQAIVDRYGAHGSASEAIAEDIAGGEPRLFLGRPAASITEIVEHTTETTSRTLAADDYRTEFEGRALLRLPGGTHPSTVWGFRVVVTYLPEAESNARRKRVLIDLVRLALAHNALASESAGDYRSQAVAYQRERERILTEVAASSGGMRVH